VLGHVDHGWRGPEEAAKDRAVLEALARSLGLPLLVSPPPPVARRRTEDDARRWRYSWLGRTAAEERCAKVATAHHLMDQAETFLLRLLRGSGPAGLAGIPARRALGTSGVEVVRPLLRVHPALLREYLGARRLSWREDPTNAEARERVQVRRRLLDLGSDAAAASGRLADLADRLRRRVEAKDRAVEARLAASLVVHPAAGAVEMRRDLLASLGPDHLDAALRLAGARIAADREGPWLTRRHVRLAREILLEGGSVDLPHGLVFRAAGSRSWLARRRPDPAEPALPALERTDLPRAEFDLQGFVARRPRDAAVVDADVLGPTARARLLRPGDRFTPFGMPAAHPVEIETWLARRGVPALARRGQVVVEGARGIAWVVGHRIDAGHRVAEGTKAVARLTLRWKPAPTR
jgi:tRNA(Ile)-lysidine synthase